MSDSLIFIVGYFLAVFLGFCSLSVVNKFSAGYTKPKTLFLGAVIIETLSFILNLLNFPLSGFIVLIFGAVVLSKIIDIRGAYLFFAMLLYEFVKFVLVIPLLSLPLFIH